MKAITVCVDYGDILAKTLPHNLKHFDEMLIVMAPGDPGTREAVASHTPKLRTYTTDAFYRYGVSFNKGLSIEEGFDALGRDGWICVLDADIVLPANMRFPPLESGTLYTPRRRMCFDPHDFTGQTDWSHWPKGHDQEQAGYFQLFSATDPVLKDRPWYPTHWKHAGGSDSEFWQKWSHENRVWIEDFEVLHLGEPGQNWWGRRTPFLDGTVHPEAERHTIARDEALAIRSQQPPDRMFDDETFQ